MTLGVVGQKGRGRGGENEVHYRSL
jgi:hypothetical protein